MRVSVLGMGSMGHALAERLLGGDHQVTVWNRSPGRADDLIAAGARAANSAAEAAEGTEVVVSSLADDAAVFSVLLPSDGPLAAQHVAVVDCTTVSPDTTGRLAAAYGERFVAAPILGAPAAVASDEAAYAVAGPAATVERLQPVWTTLTATRLPCGADPVRASVVKLLNNSLLLSGLVALAEAVATGQAAGLEDDFLTALFAATPVVAPALRNRLDDVVAGDHQGWFAMPLGAKDVDLFASLGAAYGLDLRLATTVRDRFVDAAAAGLDAADVAGVIEVIRARGVAR